MTLSGSNFNDTIKNVASSVSIAGGAGDDYIDAYGAYIGSGPYDTNPKPFFAENLTIAGGAGNDSIFLDVSRNNLIQYTLGDGNDFIKGFDATSSLRIDDNTYKTVKSGNDIIVTVGDGIITLIHSEHYRR